jgi:hypothetical protein
VTNETRLSTEVPRSRPLSDDSMNPINGSLRPAAGACWYQAVAVTLEVLYWYGYLLWQPEQDVEQASASTLGTLPCTFSIDHHLSTSSDSRAISHDKSISSISYHQTRALLFIDSVLHRLRYRRLR